MKRPTRQDDGKYHLKGNKYDDLVGSRAQVWHGTAYKTAGGLTRGDLHQNKHGRIVSKKKHATAKKERRLEKAGYRTKKGEFGAVKVSPKKSRGKSRGKRKSGKTKRRK